MDYTENVRRGAAFLDANYPDWHKRINRHTLNMEKYSTCILGQTLGGNKVLCFDLVYNSDGRSVKDANSIREGDKWAFDHGFATEQPTKMETYLYLRRAWLDLIDARLEKERGE